MNRSSSLMLSLSLPCLFLAALPVPAKALDDAAKAAIAQQYGQVSMAFEANQGQSDDAVKFQARGAGYGFYLTANETVLQLDDGDRHSTLRTRLLGARQSPAIAGETLLPGRTNYLTGNDASRWHQDVAQYRKVRYESVYPGIDVVYYGQQRQVEYDFVVAPGADPAAIRMDIRGAHALRLDNAGNLVIKTGSAELIQHKPVVYQTINGQRVAVDGRYKLEGTQLAFELAQYDRSQTLVIDPLLNLRFYLPGLHREIANAIAVDGAGNAYIAGYSTPYNYAQSRLLTNDAFVTKLNSDGTAIVYATYLGGSKSDVATAIAVNDAGIDTLAGDTFSNDFPITAAAQPARAGLSDGFVLKLSADGKSLIWSTFLGGVSQDTVTGLATDASGAAYVVGMTSSLDFPVKNALQAANAGGADAFITKLANDGTMAYSTYLGGSDDDGASSVAVDALGNAYLGGFSNSFNFPVTPGVLQPARTPNVITNDNPPRSYSYSDAFVAKLAPAGNTLSYATYLGGQFDDVVSAIAVDGTGNAYVAGHTGSGNFPIANAFRSTITGGGDVFVSKLNSNASNLVYSTYLGGESFYDYATGIKVDAAGRAWVSGFTASTAFPTRNPLQRANSGQNDVFLTALNAAGNDLAYSSYLGASKSDYSTGLALDPSGNVYVTGYTFSTNFTVNKRPTQGAAGGHGDPFVTKVKADVSDLAYSTYIGETNVFLNVAGGGPNNPDQSGFNVSLPVPLRGIIGCTLRALDGSILAGTEILFPNRVTCGADQPAP